LDDEKTNAEAGEELRQDAPLNSETEGEAVEKEEVPGKAKPGKGAVEALLFASEGPLTPAQISNVMGKRIKAAEVRKWLKELAEDLEATGRAIQLLEIGGGFRLMTRPEYAEYIKKLLAREKSSRLSDAALDTLAVVAYKQPILKADVNQIRGVESGPLLKALAEKGLIRVVGRAETLGRPILYGTSRKFMDHFGLNSIRDLPKMEK